MQFDHIFCLFLSLNLTMRFFIWLLKILLQRVHQVNISQTGYVAQMIKYFSSAVSRTRKLSSINKGLGFDNGYLF